MPEEDAQLRWYQFSLAGFLIFTVFASIWCRLLYHYRWYGGVIVFVGYPLGAIATVVYVREVTRHEGKALTVKALGACMVLAWVLHMFCVDWPLRSVAVDLLGGYIQFLYLDRVFLIFLLIALGGFQAILWAKRIPVVRRNRFVPGMLCALLVIVVFSCCAAYPKVRGLLHYHHISHDPARLIIKHEVLIGCGGPPPRSVIVVTEGNDSSSEEAKATNQSGEPPRVVVIPKSEMQRLLRVLREDSFFEMDSVLYPHGTIDGTWKTLSISDGQHEQAVASWAGVPDDEPFVRLMRRLHDELPVEVPELLQQ